MRDQELEERLRTAVEHAAPNALDRILASCEPQTQTTAVVPMRRPHARRRWAALAVAAALVLVCGLSFWHAGNSVASVVSLDVNPSIQLQVNSKERVLAADPLNEDAQVILEGMDLKGTQLNVAVNAIVGSLLQHGYLDKISSAILISALCFAMIHGSTANFLGPLTAGLLFGYMTIITGSVWPAVFGHFFNNLFYLAMSYLLKRYAAFGIWPYFVMLAAAVLFLSIYGAASCLENLIEKGRVPRLRGSGGSKAIVRSVLCPGVLVTLVLFVLKTLLT